MFKIDLVSIKSGFPHTQKTQSIQGNSKNFQVEENLRETQGIFFFIKLREVLILSKN